MRGQSSRLPSVADMLGALDRSAARLHGTFGRPDLELVIIALHTALPFAFGICGDADDVEPDAHFLGAAPFGTQAMIGRTTDVVAEAEFLNGISCALQCRIGCAHAGPPFSNGGTQCKA